MKTKTKRPNLRRLLVLPAAFASAFGALGFSWIVKVLSTAFALRVGLPTTVASDPLTDHYAEQSACVAAFACALVFVGFGGVTTPVRARVPVASALAGLWGLLAASGALVPLVSAATTWVEIEGLVALLMPMGWYRVLAAVLSVVGVLCGLALAALTARVETRGGPDLSGAGNT